MPLYWLILYIIDFYVLQWTKNSIISKKWDIFIVLQLHVKNCCNKSSMELMKFMSFHNNRFNLYRVSGLPLLYLAIVVVVQSGFKTYMINYFWCNTQIWRNFNGHCISLFIIMSVQMSKLIHQVWLVQFYFLEVQFSYLENDNRIVIHRLFINKNLLIS